MAGFWLDKIERMLDDRMVIKKGKDMNIEDVREYALTLAGANEDMPKTHWNDIYLDRIDDELTKQWIRQSYELVLSKLPKKLREKYTKKILA